MKKVSLKMIAFALAMTVVSCTGDKDFEKGKQQLESMGYTEVQNTGYNAFCCDVKEEYSTGFSALDKDSNTVEGCFCSSFLKGVTIRFD